MVDGRTHERTEDRAYRRLPWLHPQACAACGGVDELRAADDGPYVFFCAECRRQFERFDVLDPLVDVGGSG
jgi:hypothetical protein